MTTIELSSINLRGHKRFSIGMILDWAHDPLVVYDTSGAEVGSIVENQLVGQMGGQIVFWDRVRFGLNVPVLLAQGGDSLTLGGLTYHSESGAAFGDVRVGADARVFGEYGDAATIAVGLRTHLPTGSRAAFMSDGRVRMVPRALVAGEVDWFAYSARMEINLRFESSNYAGAPFGQEWRLGGAAGVRLLDKKLLIGPEAWGSTVISDRGRGFFDERSTPIEFTLTAHYHYKKWLFGIGFGPGLTRGMGSPLNRLLLSAAWTSPFEEPEPPAPSDADADGIVDEYGFMLDGTGSPQRLVFAENTSPGTTGDPQDVAETEHYVAALDLQAGGNAQITLASTTINGH